MADDGYGPGWLCNGIVDGNYTPGPAGRPWNSYGIEEQATIVDRWFAGGAVQNPRTTAPGMDENDPYFGYIAGDIRNAVSR